MPTLETVERFIARVEDNAHAEAIAEFYTEGASMQENQAAARVGRDGSVTHIEEVAWQRWEGEQIAEEMFFYDPAQQVARRPSDAPAES